MNEFQEYLREKGFTVSGLNEFDTNEKISLICANRLQKLNIDEERSVVINHFAKEFLQKNKFRLKEEIMNDPLLGTVKLHPVAVKIIDAEQFQRLRRLKQLGTVEYVYPGATHSRFEHSIGTYHIAGKVMDHLMTSQPELKIQEKDKLCVQLAALCRDMGHGPFYFVFKEALIRRDPNCQWTYEKASLRLVQEIFDEDEELFFRHTWGIDQQDVDFIKTLIMPEKQQMDALGKPLFLYDIVNNKNRGFDVHKFDYIPRDSLHLGIRSKFEYTRLVPFMRVIGDSICIRDKEINVLDDLFSSRYDLHSKAYQHPVSMGVGLMLTEAFAKIDGLENYESETDESICNKIMSLPGHDESKELIRSVKARRLWKFIGLVKLTDEDLRSKDTLSHEKVESEIKAEMDPDLCNKLKVSVSIVHFALNRNNPFLEVKFYKREQPDKAFLKGADEVKRDILHSRYYDRVIFLFSKDKDENICARLFHAFELWCRMRGLPCPYQT